MTTAVARRDTQFRRSIRRSIQWMRHSKQALCELDWIVEDTLMLSVITPQRFTTPVLVQTTAL